MERAKLEGDGDTDATEAGRKRAFEAAQLCIGPAVSSGGKRYRDETTDDLLAHSDEEDEVRAIRDRKREAAAVKKRKVVTKEAPATVSFWAPVDQSRIEAAQNLTAGTRQKDKPSEKFAPLCPMLSKPIKLKELVRINPDEETQEGRTRWLCSESSKDLSHHASLLIVKTGKLVREDVYRKIPRDKGEGAVVRMQPGQTAFSKHNVVESKVFRPAFS